MIHMRVIESVYSEVPGGRSARAAGNYSTLVVFLRFQWSNMQMYIYQLNK